MVHRIYVICEKGGDPKSIYVGCTTRKLPVRLREHRYDTKRSFSRFHTYMREKGPEKFEMKLLEEVDRGKLDAAFAEKWWSTLLGARLNERSPC